MKWKYRSRKYSIPINGAIDYKSIQEMDDLGAEGWELVSSNIMKEDGYKSDYIIVCLFKKCYE